MEEYSPPIKERETEDLIFMYISPTGEWQEDAIKQAIEELNKRGITHDQLKTILLNYKKQQEVEQREYQKKLDQNATESYSILKMIFIFFGSPLIFYPHFDSFGDKTVTDLKNENYKIKYRQRLFLLIGGGIFYLILFYLAMYRII